MTATLNPDSLLKLIGGLPFVDFGFQTKKLLTVVACLRHNINNKAHSSLQEYLLPENAYQLYQKHLPNAPTPPLNTKLTQNELLIIQETTQEISVLIPEWKAFFAIPIVYRKLLTEQISLTNPLIPQYLFVNERAFKTKLLLQEILVHEASHIWCSFIAEIFDFQKQGSPISYVLPSGTGNKDVRGILLASLFAAAAVNFYGKLNKKDPNKSNLKRMLHLHQYLDQSLDPIENGAYTTPMGSLIIERLRQFSDSVYSFSSV